MSVSPNENYELLVDELRELQQKLYKEATFEEYIENEFQNMNLKLEKQITNAQCLQKYVIFFSSNAHKIASNFFSGQYINSFIGLENQQLPLEEADIALNNYTMVAKECLNNIQVFVKLAIKTIELHPELNTTTCYSLIPSIFGNLLTKEDTDRFHQFTKMLFNTAPGVAPRFIAFAFMTPPVLDFISSLIEKIDANLCDIEHFTNSLRKSWKENAYLVPKYIIDIVSDSEHPENILFDLLLKPIILYSKYYGLTKPNDEIDSSAVTEVLKQLDHYKQELWDDIKTSPVHCMLPPSIKILGLMNKTFFTFLIEDLTVLHKFSKIAKENGYFNVPVPQYRGSHKILFFSNPNDLQRNSANQSTSNFWANQEDVEYEVRKLLIQSPFIQKTFSNCPDQNFFNELLKIKTLVPIAHQMKLELNIRRVEKLVGNKFDFRLLLDLLQKRFKERTIEHKSKLSKLAQLHLTYDTIFEISNKNTKLIKKKMTIIRYFMILEWQKDEEHQLLKDLEEKQEKNLNSQDEFLNFFQETTEKWENWLKKRHYNKWDDTIILHSFILEQYPLSLYQDMHPSLVHEDQIIASLIIDQKEEMINVFKDKFIDKFIERPELLTHMMFLLNKALNAQDPIAAAKLLGKVFHEMAFVTQTEIKEDAGGNEFTPLRLYIFILAEPRHLISYLSYISHFLYPLYNIEKYLEIMTITDALIGHFRELIKKLKPAPNKEKRKAIRLEKGLVLSKSSTNIASLDTSIRRSSSYTVLSELDHSENNSD